MNEKDLLSQLKKKFPVLVSDLYPFPKPYQGKEKVKAIVLGADPSHIVDGLPKPLKEVFQLDNPRSPYWRSIQRNIDHIDGVTLDNLYVQNLCRNYFTQETSENEHWSEIARNYWAPFLKQELDGKFDVRVPVLMTTEFILHSLLKDPTIKLKATDIYTNHILIKKEDNLLGRDLITFYRHHRYSLTNWDTYKEFIENKIIN
ncbi:hypothetical protein SAMN06265371_10620 [Lutibacter agarilyticus]|uniref:Uracil DNA glycosylase superfamily protein n=1 Tax=Lutibacter agarilyticus TaxID=1109740 RepID=A0A238XG20_9FLAO|nr:hypothetical protein [Lutibacter agarilyticus]SNR57955.1 hypothetical protein SAMN06265371_10620 [Lutibacter agarilyticus]